MKLLAARPVMLLPLLFAWLPLAALAGPIVVPTAEGQLGEIPGPGDTLNGTRFEPLGNTGEVLLGGIFVFGGGMPPPPAVSFLTDQLIEPSTPAQVSSFAHTFDGVAKSPPSSASALGFGGDFVAFSFAVDGSDPDTLTVRVANFNDSGQLLVNVTIDNIDTFPPPFPGFPPDPLFADTGLAVDDQGRITVAYTEFEAGIPQVKAQRIDALTGQLLGGTIPITGATRGTPDVALLDPAGNRLVVVHNAFISGGGINGNIIDTSGPAPVVLPEFPISTSPGLVNINPAVAADPATGAFTVAWENITGDPGDPVNIRARRYDAMGNPVGEDFVVNSTLPGDQGQPQATSGPNGEAVIVWAGTVEDDLDVFLQVYDANGQPIGGETRANSQTTGEQSRPAVRFLPDPDPKGRTQLAVIWRDVVGGGDTTPNGTGTGFGCFSLDDVLPDAIFEDGFESGDTSSWCASNP